jgi:prolyl oligopeptidase
MLKKLVCSFVLVLLIKSAECQLISYPPARTVDSSDIYFGTKVSDPYRWLESDSSAETISWIMAENKITNDYFSQIPFRERIKKELIANFNYSKITAPQKFGDWFYFFKNSGLQNQSVLYRMKNPGDTAKAEIFLDPNTFSHNGAVSFQSFDFSMDGSLFAYLISNGGSDWREIIVKDVHSGKFVGDTIKNVKFSGASWKGNDGFYYSTYDIPKGENRLTVESDHHTVYYHKLGTPQNSDQFIFGGNQQPHRYIGASVTED